MTTGVAVALLRDHVALDRVSTDFGGMIHRRPEAVRVPTRADDIVSATKSGEPVTARGRGHSAHGQSLVDDGATFRALEVVTGVVVRCARDSESADRLNRRQGIFP